MSSLRGQLLIAEPRLPDSNFFRTVVLMLEHASGGASGLILNRPSSVEVQDIWKKVSDSPLRRQETIYIGGPVEGPLASLHTNAELSDQTIMEGIHLSMQRDKLDQILADENGPVRLFSGYSGWGPGQLENEMKVGGWLTWPAQPEYVFSDPEKLYRSVCDELGRFILFGKSGSGKTPVDPSLN